MIKEKTCTKCGVLKPISNFHKDSSTKTGYYPLCKECKSNYMKKKWKEDPEYRKKTKDKTKELTKKGYYKKYMEEKRKDPDFREKHRKYMEEYWKTHDAAKMAKVRRNNPKTREKERIKAKERRKMYPEKTKAQLKKSQKKRIENGKHYAYKNKYRKERLKNDNAYKIMESCRGRIRNILKDRTVSSIDLVGCSAEKLKRHIKDMFNEKMSWENYGSYWHIDHIVPCDYFDFTKKEDQRICFNYRNLQPLEAKENIRKSNKLPENYKEIILNIKKELGLT
jgi:hypothetical protein